MANTKSPHNRRRDKPILSCTFCRGRKLRCDRQSPCGACVSRGNSSHCIYSSSEQERNNAVDYRPRARNRQQARQRVFRLESLVTEMRDMAQSPRQPLPQQNRMLSPSQVLNEPEPSLISPRVRIEDAAGKLSLGENDAVYSGSSHWATILADIQCLKGELGDDSDSDDSMSRSPTASGSTQNPSVARISLLANQTAALSREQILTMVPPRKVTDRHVSHFFNAFDLAPVFLQRTEFSEQYTKFWLDPSVADIMWVGLLFSIMTMSAFLQEQQKVDAVFILEADSELETYRALTIHCLIAGRYLQSTRWTMETLLIHIAVEQNMNVDADISSWIQLGVVIRIALRMGLHRDPSHWPNLPHLKAELRRRFWIALYQMDFFTSTQVGLPRMIKDSQCDTRPPVHLLDDNLEDEGDLRQLPSKSHLPLLYVIQRNSIIKVAAEIYDATEAAAPPPATVAALSAKLQSAVDAIPDWAKPRSLEQAIADNPATILHRMFLDILNQKAVYLLHRRSFVKGPSFGQESRTSNELCVNAALKILEYQVKLSEETQPGGLLFGVRWKVATSLNHEFLQATMMLCFALNRSNENIAGSAISCAVHKRADVTASLTAVRSLWEEKSSNSNDARRAVKAITAVLNDTPITSYEDFEPTSEPTAQDNLADFDWWQNVALDHSIFETENDIGVFGQLGDCSAEASMRTD